MMYQTLKLAVICLAVGFAASADAQGLYGTDHNGLYGRDDGSAYDGSGPHAFTWTLTDGNFIL